MRRYDQNNSGYYSGYFSSIFCDNYFPICINGSLSLSLSRLTNKQKPIDDDEGGDDEFVLECRELCVSK